METMTPRERFYRTLRHQEPDRVPIIFGATLSTDILECPPEGRGYSRLCRYLGLTEWEKPELLFAFNSVLNVDERLLRRLHSDFRRVDPTPPPVQVETDGSRTVLGVYCGLRVKRVGLFDDVFAFPLADYSSAGELASYPYWPTREDFTRLARGKAEEAKQLQKGTDYVVVVDNLLIFPFLIYALLRGWENFFIDMKTNPHFFFALADRLLEVGFGIVDSFLGAVGPYLNMVATYGDMGTQQGLLCSRKDYRQFIRPYEQRMIARIKRHTDAVIYRHSCGSVYELIPDFIENGVQVLNPVQPRARNMEPWRLKQEFGKDLTFCGGIDTQELLCHGSRGEVKAEVCHTLATYGAGGGYIVGPAHSLEPDVSAENIVALYETAYTYGRYPLGTPREI